MMMAKRETIELRIEKGCLVPLDDRAKMLLRSRGYAVGDVVTADLRKERNGRYHRLVFALGNVVAENIEAFEGMDAHSVLKKLQLESEAGCERKGVSLPGVGACTVIVPRSLSYQEMDETEFQAVSKMLCAHVAKAYWPTMSAEDVERMAANWIGE
jgi:hypothetical protein